MKMKSIASFNLITLVGTLTCFLGCVVLAADPTVEVIPFHVISGGSTNVPCPGKYTGYATYTNALGQIWVIPPTNATSGTFTDVSGYPSPYISVAAVMRGDLTTWCDTNSVTFPATNSQKYKLMIYVKSTPPPTNGQPITMQMNWNY